MLTDTKLRNLKPRDKLYKVNDRDGLYVAVTPAGSISFRYNYSINGRQETITFGRYGVGGITLAEARERLGEARRMVADGKSPANAHFVVNVPLTPCASPVHMLADAFRA